jgi:hypothetical protein
MQKLYCYVDETGKEKYSQYFIVSVVIFEKDREKLLAYLEQLEESSGKRKDKWGRAKHQRRMTYLRNIFADERFKGCLRYAKFPNPTDFDTATIDAIVKVVGWNKPTEKFTTLVYVDGLKKTKRREYGVRLRKLGLPVRKIQGVTKDESNALIRLADAIAGFVGDALEGKSDEINDLFEKTRSEEVLIEV